VTTAHRRFAIALLAVVTMVLFWLAPDSDIPEPAGILDREPAEGSRDAVAVRLPALRQWPVKVAVEPLPEPTLGPSEAETESRSPASHGADGAGAAAGLAQQAPPSLPFRYIGRLASEGGATVFLASRGETASAEAGATLPGGWRLDSIRSDRLDFTHVPTNTRQSLNIIPP